MFRAAIRPAALRAIARPVPVARPFLRTLVSKRYTPEHEWVSYDDSTGLGTIGITEYAQKTLGDVVYIELPAKGTHVAAGEEMGAVESVKAASDIFAPVGGQIVEVNGELEGQPDLLNKSAEADGWLARIQLSNPGEFEELLSADAYKVHCSGGTDAASKE
ncbi:hypothetical protein JCM8097_003688 [Rhodosporidiobolus ruineniae]